MGKRENGKNRDIGKFWAIGNFRENGKIKKIEGKYGMVIWKREELRIIRDQGCQLQILDGGD